MSSGFFSFALRVAPSVLKKLLPSPLLYAHQDGGFRAPNAVQLAEASKMRGQGKVGATFRAAFLMLPRSMSCQHVHHASLSKLAH